MLDSNPVGQMIFLSDRELLVILMSDGTREGAIKAVVKSSGWDSPSLSDWSELSGFLRLSAGLKKVFFGVGDSHSKSKQFAKRRKRIGKKLIEWWLFYIVGWVAYHPSSACSAWGVFRWGVQELTTDWSGPHSWMDWLSPSRLTTRLLMRLLGGSWRGS